MFLFLLLALTQAHASPGFGPTHPPLPQGPCANNRVISITDSHGMSPFFQHLEDWLVSLPDFEVHTYNLGGTSPYSYVDSARKHSVFPPSKWAYHYDSCGNEPRVHRLDMQGEGSKKMSLHPPLLSKILGSAPREVFDKEIVIIELGTIMHGPDEDFRRKVVAELVTLVKSRPNTSCFWIGPPKPPRAPDNFSHKQVYSTLAGGILLAGGGCTLIDSRPHSDYPESDLWVKDVHYLFSEDGIPAGIRWADHVIERINQAERLTP